jgi:hypothetical protein
MINKNLKIEQLKKHLCENYLHITNPDYIFPTVTDYPVDIYFTATTINNREIPYVGEIKEREYPLADPKNKITYWMLELKKINDLKNEKNHIPLYINFFPNNRILVWNLNKIDFSKLEIKEMLLEKNTLEDNGKVMKKFYDLPSDWATLIRY